MLRKSLEVLQPDPNRKWYRHCYGIKMSTWEFPGGYIERIYFLNPIHLSPELYGQLNQTVMTMISILDAEINAAWSARPTPKDKDAPS